MGAVDNTNPQYRPEGWDRQTETWQCWETARRLALGETAPWLQAEAQRFELLEAFAALKPYQDFVRGGFPCWQVLDQLEKRHVALINLVPSRERDLALLATEAFRVALADVVERESEADANLAKPRSLSR